jgi:hypothetical protein
MFPKSWKISKSLLGPVKKIIPLYIPFTGRKICTVDEENMAKRKREIVGKGRGEWG